MARSDTKPDVSVIVPVHNPGIHFRQLLESLAAQASDALEVVLVDNGSTDGTPAIAESFTSRMSLRTAVAPSPANGSYARNVGAALASADKLLFADADDELAPGYVAAMSAALDAHEFVTSRVDSVSLNPAWVRGAHGDPWSGVIKDAFGFMPATGPNVGIRRRLFERAGGWPESFTGSQDVAFAWNVQLAGAPLHEVADAVYRYRYRSSIRGLFRQTRNWGYSNALLYRTFRAAGMPGRAWSTTVLDWTDGLRRLARARSQPDLASAAVVLGYCVGRLIGSIRYRVRYL
jgi:glycosyltransferase involved in cell wall biosynthesis